MTIAHGHDTSLSLRTRRTRQLISRRNNSLVANFLSYRVFVTMAGLLHNALQSGLLALERLVAEGAKRSDWPVTCLTLCLIASAVESMQVDALLRRDNPRAVDPFLESYPIDSLSAVLEAQSHGFNPLWLDWTDEGNAMLVESNENVKQTLSNIQYLSQEYGLYC